MKRVFVLIEAQVGKDLEETLEEIKKINGVVLAYRTTGPYDIIAQIEVKDHETIGDIIVEKINPLVSRTVTCLILS